MVNEKHFNSCFLDEEYMNSKKRVIVWGTGKYGEIAYKSINLDMCIIVMVVDSSKEKIGKEWNGYKIKGVEDISSIDFDWLIIGIKDSTAIYNLSIIQSIKEKVIRIAEDDLSEYDWLTEKYIKIERENKAFSLVSAKKQNQKYEEKDSEVNVLSACDCLDKIKNDGSSMARYGDGEFEIMGNKERPWFQEPNEILATRLREIIKYESDDFIIAIPDQFGNLEKYSEEAANEIRCYMVNARERIMSYLDFNREYYDAYVSRPFLLYEDKEMSSIVFEKWKQIWDGKEVLIVEGANTRNGIGNDLFSGASKVERIICPIKNAFDRYDDIITAVEKKINKDKMVLISLGPTATVLAYDLYKKGYQAIDIGQIDNEYEWYLSKANKRVHIEGKAVPELGEQSIMEYGVSDIFLRQVIADLSM